MGKGKNKKRHAMMDEAMVAWYEELEAEYDYYFEGGLDEDEIDEDEAPEDVVAGPSEQDIAAWQGVLEDLLEAVPRNPVADTLIPGAVEDDLAAVFGKAALLLGDLEPLPTRDSPPFDPGVVSGFRERLNAILSDLEQARLAVAARVRKRQEYTQRIAEVKLPEGFEDDEKNAFDTLVKTATEDVAKTPLPEETIGIAIKALTTKAREIAEAVEQRKTENGELVRRVQDVKPVPCMPHQETERTSRKEALEKALAAPITAQRNKDAAVLVEAYKKWEAQITLDMAALGGPDAADELCSELGYAPDKVADLIAAFGDVDAVKQAITVAGNARDLGKLTKAGLDPKDVKAVGEGIGAGFLQQMIAFDPAKVVALKTALGPNLAKVAQAAKDTGLDTKPKALLALFKTGCKGDAAAFNTLLFTDFADPEAQADLKGLVTSGGLGDAPDALGALMATGCNGKGTALKTLAAKMKSTDARKGLSNLLGAGKLKGEDPVKPDCLAALLQHSVEKPVPPDLSDDQAKGFAALCVSMKTGEGATNLGNMLTAGGLGSDPKVLGPLLSTGCKGDSTAFNNLTNGIKGSLPQLEKLLKDGGFGTEDRGDKEKGIDPKATGIKPECLGTLFATGCDGKPVEMNRLLSKLTADPHFAAMKGLMVDGSLGTHPKVLGEMYRVGCLKSPVAADDTEKDPQLLLDTLYAFRDKNGPKAFKSLLDDGGFGEADKEHRLGCTMRYAFTGKAGRAPKDFVNKPKPGRLRELQTAFDGDMTRLKSLVDAIDAPCPGILPQGRDKQPGMGLQNLYNAPGILGDVSKFESQFMTSIEARAPHSNFSLEELLQNGASFEFARVPKNAINAQVNVNGGGGRAVNQSMRMDHIAERHSRKYSDLEPSANAVTAPTSLFPEGTSLVDIRNAIQTAARNAPAPRRYTDFPRMISGGGHPLSWPNGNPKHETFVAMTVADGRPGGGRAKIGFAYEQGTVTITQFVPKGGTNVKKLDYRDLEALKVALK